MGFRSMFRQDEASFFRVVVEDLGVASPVHGGLKLALHFVLTEVLVENIVEEFFRNRMVRLGVQHVVDRLQNRDVAKRSVTEENLTRENVGVDEGDALGSDFDLAFLETSEAEQDRSFDNGKQVVNITYAI